MGLNGERVEYLKRDYLQGFPAYCGFAVDRVEEGLFETRLDIRAEHRQQDGFVHAGVIATMADHTGGYAAYTVVSEAFRILTIEFKINFFKPAVGDLLCCRSRVVHRGRRVIVSESEVFSRPEDAEKRVAKATITLMAVPASGMARTGDGADIDRKEEGR